jgi:hypothetical protein
LARFDPADLAFGLVVLARTGGGHLASRASAALKVLADAQTEDGAWPTARFVPFGRRGFPLVSSHEIAASLASLGLNAGRALADADMDVLIGMLAKSFRLIRTTKSGGQGIPGWRNDRLRWWDYSESWATALVLGFLVTYRDLLLAYRQDRILRRYNVREWAGYSDSRALAGHSSPIPMLGEDQRFVKGVPNIDPFEGFLDPLGTGEIVGALNHYFVKPAQAQWPMRPATVSLVLQGPPGTGKTSITAGVAKALGWPLLSLSPPDFLMGGLEGLEARTSRIFDDLMRLRRVVVLLDECEELFRARNANASVPSTQRTSSAFITAGMLPRLGELHNRRWVIFVLATNSEIEEFDSAVLRSGRFDFLLELGYPTVKAQKEFVDLKVHDKEKRDDLKAKLEAGATDAKANPVTFAVLDVLARQANGEELPDLTGNAIDSLVNQASPPSLVKRHLSGSR